MKIVDTTTRRKSRVTTASFLAGRATTTAKVLDEASNVQEYNNLRKNLEFAERITKYEKPSERLWTEEYSRLKKKKELNQASVAPECRLQQNSEQSLPSTSVSKSYFTSAHNAKNGSGLR